MTMFSDSVHKCIPETLRVSIARGDESRPKFKLACSRDFVGGSNDAGTHKKLYTGAARSDSLAVLIASFRKLFTSGSALSEFTLGAPSGT